MKCYELIAQSAAHRSGLPVATPGSLDAMLQILVANPHLLAEDADIRTYRTFVETNGHCFADPIYHDKPKCSIRAAEIRREGNQLYTRKLFEAALMKYNESICASPNESQDLAFGYANRSAVYYEQGFYDVALVNIALAKKHNYPEALMPKLLTREANCRSMQKDIRFPLVEVSLETNPKIPFLAKGIQGRQHPSQGPIMVAKRDFKAGDVILREKPMIACVSWENVFTRCNYCISTNLSHLIPCPNCATAMFCDEECMRKAQNVHRFECGVCAETSKMNDFWLGPKLFFHGLALFNDDITKMMKFCKRARGSDSFYNLDYSKYNPLDEFKTFLTAKSRRPGRPLYDNIIQFNAAIFYEIYMKVPLVRTIMASEEQKDFMQQCFVDYQIQKRNLTFRQDSNGHLYPIASCFGHSCDPNTVLLNELGNELKMIVLRPIRRGEQIHFSYGPSYDQGPEEHEFHLHSLGFDCLCDVCDPNKCYEWLTRVTQPSSIDAGHLAVVRKVVNDEELSYADKLNALQQFIQRYGFSHPQEDYAGVVLVYRGALTEVHTAQMNNAMRRKICG